jgi:hypothetical protein
MKIKLLTATLAAMLCLTACGEKAKTDTPSEKPADAATEYAEYEEVTTETFTEPAVVEDVPVETIPETNESVVDPPLADFSTPTELSTTYADLRNRSFKYNGKLMTVGVSTLQDFIDAGATFKEDTYDSHSGLNFDVEFSHDFKGQFPYGCLAYYLDYESCGQKVEAFFITPDGSPRKLRDCVLAKISVYVDDSIKPESGNNITDKLEFAFDRTLTHDSLVANSGEPTYVEDYFSNYKVVSEKTPNHDSGYSFGFNGDGTFGYAEISWIP